MTLVAALFFSLKPYSGSSNPMPLGLGSVLRAVWGPERESGEDVQDGDVDAFLFDLLRDLVTLRPIR